MEKYIIYCLRLEHGCYYVGRTTNLERRLAEHANGAGSAWTKLHPMICLETKKENCDALDEDKYVKWTMQRVGIHKVRGGSYSQVNLSTEQIASLQRELFGAGNKCFRCGSDKHFVKDCPTRATSRTQEAESSIATLIVTSLLGLAREIIAPRPQRCRRCGKTDHNITDCPVRENVTCSVCGGRGHLSPACPVMVTPVQPKI